MKIWSVNEWKKAEPSWRSLANNLNLDFGDYEATGDVLAGVWQEYRIRLSAFRKAGQCYTRFEIKNHHIFNSSFQLTRQNLINDLFEKMGQTDIQIGVPDFDDVVLIRAWHVKTIQSLLLQKHDLRYAISNLLKDERLADIEITHAGTIAAIAGWELDTLQVVSILQSLREVVALFDQSGSEIEATTPAEVVTEAKEQEISVLPESPDEVEPPELTSQPLPEVEVEEVAVAVAVEEERICFEGLSKGMQVDWPACRLLHIIPESDTGRWMATCQPGRDIERPVIKFRFGRATKAAIDKRSAIIDIPVKGEVVEYHDSSGMVLVDADDYNGAENLGGREKVYRATVVVNL